MSNLVEIHSLRAHMPRVSLRPLFAILIAVGMLFAPFSMQTGSAMAAMPSDPHSQMTEQGHCGEQPAKGMADKSIGKSCCAAMCTTIAINPALPIVPLAFPCAVERPTLSLFPHSYLASLATPPPRTA